MRGRTKNEPVSRVCSQAKCTVCQARLRSSAALAEFRDLFVGNATTNSLGLGKWSTELSGGTPTTNDRAGFGVGVTPPIDTAEDDNDNHEREYYRSPDRSGVGTGATPAALTPAAGVVTSFRGPADFFGSGKYFEPFSDTAANGTTNKYRSILGSFLNYADFRDTN